jgi:tetratricopeptide (TPR) repeat protein
MIVLLSKIGETMCLPTKKENRIAIKFIALFLLIFSFTVTGCKTKKKGKTIKGKQGSNASTKKDDKKEDKDSTSKEPTSRETEVKNSSSDSKTDNKTNKRVVISGNQINKNPATSGKNTVNKQAVKLSKKEALNNEIRKNLNLATNYLKKSGNKNQLSAIKAAKNVLKLNFRSFPAMLIIAEAEYKLGSFGKMAAALVRIRELRSKMKPPTKTTGKWHVFMGRYYLNKARDFGKKGFVSKSLYLKGRAKKEFAHPTTDSIGEAQFVRGSLLLEGGYYVKALASFKKAEQLGGSTVTSNWRFYLNYGVTFLYNKQYVQAEKKLKYCLRALNSKCFKCHFNLALIYSLWIELPKLGSYTTKDRANLVIKHAAKYRNHEKTKRNYDKILIEKLNKWILLAKDRK